MKTDAKIVVALAVLGGGAMMALGSKGGARPGTTSTVKAPPPYTISPKGRYLTEFERYVLGRLPYDFPFKGILDSAKLWFERPKSSFVMPNDAANHVTTEALTTKDGLYFPFANREFATPKEFALLAHELTHWYQFSSGKMSQDSAENELPAYQNQIAAKEYLDDSFGDLVWSWTESHPGWTLT